MKALKFVVAFLYLKLKLLSQNCESIVVCSSVELEKCYCFCDKNSAIDYSII